MVHLLAQTDPETVWLMHPVWPLLMAATVIGWAYVVARLDKDAAYFYLPRFWLNLGHLAVGALAFTLMLLIPFFFLGLILAIGLIVGGVVGYGYYHNSKVPEDQQWSFNPQELLQRLEQRQHAQAQRRAKMTLFDPDGAPLDVPTSEEPELPAHETLEDVAAFAFEREAEAIEFAVDSERAGVFARVDGVRYPFPEPIEPQLAVQVIDYLKTSANLDVGERRKRQLGRLALGGAEHGRHKLELETSGSTRGLTLTASIDPTTRMDFSLEELGLLEPQRQPIEQFLNNADHGAVILAGPRRQGISTTLYSLFQQLDPYTQAIVTLEDRKLTDCEGVHHHEVGENATAEQFNKQLGTLLRGDPHVLVLSHLADERTAGLVAEATGDHVRAFFPLLEETTFSALQSWVKLVGDPQKAADALGLILSQRLVRRLCPDCRVAYKPDAKALKKLNLPADKVSRLYRASGKIQTKEDEEDELCQTCHGLGYRGRIGVFEVMHFDDEARALVGKGATDQLQGHLRKQRMLWMQEAALHRVVQGVTDVKEITRVLGGGQTGGNRNASSGQAGGQKPAAQG